MTLYFTFPSKQLFKSDKYTISNTQYHFLDLEVNLDRVIDWTGLKMLVKIGNEFSDIRRYFEKAQV